MPSMVKKGSAFTAVLKSARVQQHTEIDCSYFLNAQCKHNYGKTCRANAQSLVAEVPLGATSIYKIVVTLIPWGKKAGSHRGKSFSDLASSPGYSTV